MITREVVVCLLLVAVDKVVAQNTETNIHITDPRGSAISNNTTPQNASTPEPVNTNSTNRRTDLSNAEPNFFIRLYNAILKAVTNFFKSPRVMTVFKNVGTCMVNGAMEIVTYYVPAPMIPLVASAAGMIIPFEPVVTLREKMPVTSYRRAFNKAVNSFMGTFDKYKDVEVEDPYMTRRFNRRFMNDSPERKSKHVEEDNNEEKRYL